MKRKQETKSCAFGTFACSLIDEESSESSHQFMALPCGHSFHLLCLREILGTKCLGFKVMLRNIITVASYNLTTVVLYVS
jgi:hypothetical protein